MLYCTQPQAVQGRTAILSIDAATGRSETLTSLPGIRIMEHVTADDRAIQMFNLSGPTNWPRWEIESAEKMPGPVNGVYTSRDGKWAMSAGVSADGRREFRIRPGNAGNEAWEHLVYIRKQAPDLRGPVALKFSPDGQWLVYHDLDADGKDALFRVSTTGGEPQRLGDYPTTSPNSYLNISLDGRNFIIEATALNPASAEGLQAEYWILKNFTPTVSAVSKP